MQAIVVTDQAAGTAGVAARPGSIHMGELRASAECSLSTDSGWLPASSVLLSAGPRAARGGQHLAVVGVATGQDLGRDGAGGWFCCVEGGGGLPFRGPQPMRDRVHADEDLPDSKLPLDSLH